MEKILYLHKGYIYLSFARIAAALSLLIQLLFCLFWMQDLELYLNSGIRLYILFFSIFLPFYISLDLLYTKYSYKKKLSLDISSKKEVERYLLHKLINVIGKT